MGSIPYDISVSNTKASGRVIIKLESNHSESLCRYLTHFVHKWAEGKENEPLKCNSNSPDLSEIEFRVTKLEAWTEDVSYLVREIYNELTINK